MQLEINGEYSEVVESAEDDDVADRIKTLEQENSHLKKQLFKLRQFIPSPGDPYGGS